MDLTIKTETLTANENVTWLGSRHGTDTAEPITLDRSLFTATFPNGFIPSGVALGKITATGKYGPYSNAAVDGRETCQGHLLTTIEYDTVNDNDPGGALLWHGQIIRSKLPVGHGLDAAGEVEAKLIHYIP